MSRAAIVVYAVTGLLAYGFALALTVPAAWLARAVEDASRERLQVRDASGTLWSGTGTLVARTADRRALDLGELRWTARPSGWFPPRLRAEVRLAIAARPVLLELSPSGVAVEHLDVQLPGAVLPALAPALATFGPQGTIRVHSDSLRLERRSYFGLAEVEWRRAALRSQPGVRLGSHIARVRGAGEKVDIDLGTLEGPLRLAGKATWRSDGAFEIAGTAEPGTPELVPFLKGMCATYRGSACEFAYSTTGARAARP